MEFDGVAALRVWPVDVEVGAQAHRIPARPALDWILAIVGGDLADVVPGMIPTTDVDLDDRLADGEVTVSDLLEAARDAISTAAGLPWWVAMRLVRISIDYPAASGELTLRGVRADAVSLGAWCAATYQTIVREAEDKQRQQIDHDLSELPEGARAEDVYDEQAAADAFEVMFAARGGQVDEG